MGAKRGAENNDFNNINNTNNNMATFSFTKILASNSVKIELSATQKIMCTGAETFIMSGANGWISANDDTNKIKIRDTYGDYIEMDSETDTININGNVVTGSATEIAEQLATDVFIGASMN